MTQSEVNQAVARTLGEDIRDVNMLGFTILDPQVEFFDPECDCQDPQVLDWDASVFEPGVQSLHEVAA